MFQSYSSPITSENFPQVWQYTDRKLRFGKKTAAIRSVVPWISCPLFFCVFVVLSFGVLYTMCGELIHAFVAQFDLGVSIWTQFEQKVLASCATEVQRIVRCLLLLYAVPFCASVPAAALILLVYHPFAQGLPTGSDLANAKSLSAHARHARSYAERTYPKCLAFFSVLFAVSCGAAFMALLLYSMDQRDNSSFDFTVNWQFFGAIALTFILYRLSNIPLTLMLKVLHFCPFPKSLVPDIDAYVDSLEKASQPAAQ